MSGVRRLHMRVQGVVQGVGFRPFVFRLARELGLGGWVLNDGGGVVVEVEGPAEAVEAFCRRMEREKPPPAVLYAVEIREVVPRGERTFVIRSSTRSGPPRVWILPDLATCGACWNEVRDPRDRRYRYPFTNCTHCGPRFTIIESLPYDRPRTTMKDFPMCPACLREYRDPEDRRFHAQPNACPRCGPRLLWYEVGGKHPVLEREAALKRALEKIREGATVAVKGLGGIHLVVDARNEVAVQRLRQRKHRPRKPFAVMYPSLALLKRHVEVPPGVEGLLQGPQAPILLLPRKPVSYEEIAPSVAGDSPYLGVFLPYTPLHGLMLEDLGFPVVATSGNRSDDPMEFEDAHALEALAPLVDGFLLHDRPIRRHVDDSVVMVLFPRVPGKTRPVMVRRARGYVPLPLLAPRELPPMVALGGHMNVTLGISRGREIVLSQHLGDMDGVYAREVYLQVLEDFLDLYGVRPVRVVHDRHPDYFTTHLARDLAHRWGVPVHGVQHHHAHLAAVVLEYGLEEEVLGLTWDGTGYGTDGTVWGGEILLGDARAFRRVASLLPFRLPGGERAVREPWRVALVLLKEAVGEVPEAIAAAWGVEERVWWGVEEAWRRKVHAPVTTSMGRLFDGIAAILGLAVRVTHQAEAAQAVEYAAWRSPQEHAPYPWAVVEDEGVLWLDWRPMVRAMVEDRERGVEVPVMALRFHRTLVAWLEVVLEAYPGRAVVCGGGVFLNRLLDEDLLTSMERWGRRCVMPRMLPPTDGALAAGQLWVAASQVEAEGEHIEPV